MINLLLYAFDLQYTKIHTYKPHTLSYSFVSSSRRIILYFIFYIFSKFLISIYFFYTPTSAKAETCPAWWNNREFIYFPHQPLLGAVTGGITAPG